jgi:hypothetical protein
MKVNLKRFYDLLNGLINLVIPKTRKGDYLFSLLHFLRVFKRFPRNKFLLNDYLFHRKLSVDALSPLRGYVTDKVWVKDYIKLKVGEDHAIPNLAVFDRVEAFNSYKMPDSCCIKPAHASGEYILRKHGEAIDEELIRSWFKLNYYKSWREINYRYFPPRVIVEPLIFNSANLIDYKAYCFNGAVKFFQAIQDRDNEHPKQTFLSPEWEVLGFSRQNRDTDQYIEQPNNLNKMKEIATLLSKDFEFIRVDLYSDGSDVYVGELTHCPQSGLGKYKNFSHELSASNLLFSD